MTPAEQYKTWKEAAEFIGLSERTLARYVKKGMLRPTRQPSPTGGRDLIRFDVKELEQFWSRRRGRQ